MKKILFIILIGMLTSSCASTFFFSTLATTSSDVEQVENGDFLIDKDSIWVAYSFNGEGAPIQITVFNKSHQPLYVDWKKSALIVDDQAQSYPNNTIAIEGTKMGNVQPDIFDINGNLIINQDFSAHAQLPEYVSFVPPQTMISHVPAWLRVIDYSAIPKDNFEKTKMPDKQGELRDIEQVIFLPDDTPLKFKSYLTVYAMPSQPIVFNHEFYLQNVVKSKALTPKKMPDSVLKRGDVFYIEKPANNTGWQITAGTGIIVGAAAVDVLISQ